MSEFSSSSGLWGDVRLPLCWLLGVRFVVDLIFGSVGQEPFLAKVTVPWPLVVPGTNCISAVTSFWFLIGWSPPASIARSLSIS